MPCIQFLASHYLIMKAIKKNFNPFPLTHMVCPYSHLFWTRSAKKLQKKRSHWSLKLSAVSFSDLSNSITQSMSLKLVKVATLAWNTHKAFEKWNYHAVFEDLTKKSCWDWVTKNASCPLWIYYYIIKVKPPKQQFLPSPHTVIYNKCILQPHKFWTWPSSRFI